ncbi:LssY C-terminal domain-containing protein [Alloyangia pacifica]|uniref:LssY C-terminal domain-containing protein n=1 Tax=Alloyangia pacifica TaxID=311180 RepID=UPI001CFEEC30|nr:LssY C-terminal domain-containing protein [Alloyangia pacifica]
MGFSVDQILPSLESFGLWSYWIIGLAALLEAVFVTGVFLPGTLVVDAGGILVQQGALDFFDLVWFVAIGSVVGGEFSYRLGHLLLQHVAKRRKLEDSASYRRAVRLFERYGGLALVMGRFLGPVSGLVPLAASAAGMPRRRFALWNAVSGVPYALVHVGFGFVIGHVATSFGPYASRLGIIAVVVLVAVLLLWWVVLRILRLLPFFISVLTSVAHAIRDNPDVRKWTANHPKTAAFLARRFDRTRFTGLTATVLGCAAVYILWIWCGSVFDFLMADPIVLIDTRLASLIHAFWSPDLLRLASHVTALGDWRVIALLGAAAAVLLLERRRPDLLLGLGVALAGDLVSVFLLKRIFHRPRSDLGFFTEVSGSFPSGHAGLSVAFYGFLFFILWRVKLLRAPVALVGAVTLAFFVGLSRVYLIEHYLSDVLNGWLVGAIWLLAGVAASEWWRDSRSVPKRPERSALGRIAVLGLAVISVTGAAWQIATYDKARNVPIPMQADTEFESMDRLIASGHLPGGTESVAGTALEPINAMFLARDVAAVESALTKAEWVRAADPDFATLTRAALAAWSNGADATAPVTPYFWNNLPNDLAFQKQTSDATLRKRHHIRLWRTDFANAEGLRLFVGAASFDDGLNWGVDWGLLHHIDPNVDAERDGVVADLQAAGEVTASTNVRLSQPRLGQSVAGDPWFSDGIAAVLTLR